MTDREALVAAKTDLASSTTKFEYMVSIIFSGLLSKPKDPENPCAYSNYPSDLIKEAISNTETLIRQLNVSKK